MASLLPSAARHVARLVDDLASGVCLVLVVTDRDDPAEIGRLLQEELHRRDLLSESLTLDGPGEPLLEVAALAGAQWERTDPRTVRSLAQQQLPWDVLICWPDVATSTSVLQPWLGFLSRWGQQIQMARNEGGAPAPLALIIPASSSGQAPIEDLYLRVRRWTGTPSVLEQRLAVRLASGLDETPDHWREALLPSLCLGDLQLQERLWDAVHTGTQGVEESLIQHAASLGWAAESIREWLSQSNGSEGTAVIDRRDLHETALWGRGVLCRTPEFGPELHSSAVAVLGRRDLLLHRVWRGQAAFLLPALDQLRLELCRALTSRLGKQWPFKWIPPDSPMELRAARNDPMACGWGHLSRLILRCPQVRSVCDVGRLVSVAADMRNDLAHYRPVSRREFVYFVAEAAANRPSVGADHYL